MMQREVTESEYQSDERDAYVDADEMQYQIDLVLAAHDARWKRRALAITRWLVVLMIIPVVLFTYWLVRPYSSITLTPFQTNAAVYEQGEIVTMSNRFCYKDITFISFRYFANPDVKVSAGTVEIYGYPNSAAGVTGSRAVATPGSIPQPVTPVRDSNGCVKSTVRIQIPETLPPGNEWHVIYSVAYKANPIRTVTVDNKSNGFTVIPSDAPPMQ